MLGVEVVERAYDGAVWRRQLEYHHAAAGLKDTQHLAEALLQMHEVADAEGAGNSVEGRVFKRQRFGVGILELRIEN